MFRRFLNQMAQNSSRHMRKSLKIIFAGIVGGQMVNLTGGITAISILKISITSFIYIGALLIAYETIEWIYGRPDDEPENKNRPTSDS